MATEYIGSRYVPKFTDNPESQWTNTVTYEPLTIVLYQGNSYTSRQFVPIGIDISNTDYWAETGNYNAQVEAYRQEVATFDSRITANAGSITANTNTISTINGTLETISSNLDDLDSSKVNHQRKAILIGDSYLRNYSGTLSDGTAYESPGWGDYFASYTGWDCSTRYKSGGAGWVNLGSSDTEAGLNFNGMLDKAYADMPNTTDRAQIDYIVCQGLINDLATSQTQANIINAVHTFCNNARDYFPNARIVISMALCSKQYMCNNDGIAIITSLERLMRSGCIFANMSNLWFANLVDSYGRGDDIHPNPNGYIYLARMMARNAIGQGTIYNNYTISRTGMQSIIEAQIEGFANWGNVSSGTIHFVNGMAFFELQITITDATQVPSSFGQLVYFPIIKGYSTTIINYATPIVTHAGNYYTTIHGITLGENNYNYNGGVGVDVFPRVIDYEGNNITYANNDIINYQTVIPLMI